MLLKFIKLCLIFIVIGGGILIYNQPVLRNMVISHIPSSVPGLKDVKGISTEKAGKITGDLKSDVNKGIANAQKQALNLKVSDLMNFLNRSQKITSDFRNLQDNIKKQFESFGKK